MSPSGKDEKNIRYTQVLKLFGDLSVAGISLTGLAGKFVKALCSGPLLYEEIISKVASGKKRNLQLPDFAKHVLNQYSGHFRQTTERRISTAHSSVLTKESTESDILEKFTKMGVIKRKWKLDRCLFCDREYWVNDINLSLPIHCPGCDNIIPIKDKVRVGYELNELVHLTVKDKGEGIIPVILTARFLRNLSRQAFFWMPGTKLAYRTVKSDIDVLACCDGKLVAAECKSLEDTPATSKTWNKIYDQLAAPIEIAKTCNFDIFVVSALNDRFPDAFKKEITALAGKALAIEFLTKTDLHNGYRKSKDANGHESRLDIKDILDPQWRSRIKKRHRGHAK